VLRGLRASTKGSVSPSFGLLLNKLNPIAPRIARVEASDAGQVIVVNHFETIGK
jgi:hypothetical protein